MYLTAREIKDIAEYAGFRLEPLTTEEEESDFMDTEYWVGDSPDSGIMDENGVIKHYSHVISCDGSEENEVYPLGNPIL